MMSKKLVSLILVVLMMLSMATFAMAEDTSITVVDMYNREVVLTEPVTRIVALSPSDCEILCALGCEDMLVGRGMYCDYPTSILELPALATGYDLNIEEILALEPQVVVISDMNQSDEQVKQLEENGVQVVVSKNTDIEGVYTAIRMLSALTGKEVEGEAIIAYMQHAFAYIASISEPSEKTIYFEVSPLEYGLYTGGKNTFLHELAQLCGMKNAFEDVDQWASVSQEQVIDRNPDYIVLISGMGEDAPSEVLAREGWEGVTAIQNAAIYNADNSIMTRPAPRLVDAAEGLYEFLYGTDIEIPALLTGEAAE